MKRLFLYFLLTIVTVSVFSQTTVFNQQVQSVDGTQLSLSSFSGKKILVAICSASSPDISRLQLLDKIAKDYSASVRVIIAPVIDLGSTGNPANLKQLLIDSLHMSFVVINPVRAAKASGVNQNTLMKWLTSKTLNSHFDYDVEKIWQMFVISEKGRLFAVLEGADDVKGKILTDVLNAKAPED